MWREGEIYRARLKSLGWSGAQEESESERSEIDIAENKNKRSSHKSSDIESSFPGDISKITSGLKVPKILSLLSICSPFLIN